MAGGGLHRPPYDAALAILLWAAEQWAWAEGKALRDGLTLLTLAPPQLYSVLVTYWMEWHLVDEEVRRPRRLMISSLENIGQVDGYEVAEAGTAEDPFAGVMRDGPAGVNVVE